MAQTTLTGVDGVRAALGTELGTSEWLTVTQDRVDRFADATDDHQWIHVDPERAKDGPFGTTIAHGYLTVALSNRLLPEIVDVQGFSAGVNYGLDKVRFPTPVRVGDRIRGRAVLDAVDDVPGGIQTHVRITIEIEGADKPAAIIDSISRYLL
jgi:acyl dehydratase